MSNQQEVNIRLDDRIRLVSAVLSVTDWPEKAQARKPHGTHAHARRTSDHLKSLRDHEAVKGMQGLLDNGAPMEAMFALVTHLPWPSLKIDQLPKWVPAKWNVHLADFYQKADLEGWWQQEAESWDSALAQSRSMFKDSQFREYLSLYVGNVDETFVFVPNISYPSDREVAMRIGRKDLYAVVPPRLAWGDSPPWPYDEDKPYLHRVTLMQYARLLLMTFLRANSNQFVEAARSELPVSDRFKSLYPTWHEQFVTLFVHAATAIYLEDYMGRAEMRAYVQDRVRVGGIEILPGAVSVLRRYLQERENGKFETIADYMPVFPKQLRVAKRIISI